MTGQLRTDERLQWLRDAWPRHISAQDVRDDTPSAYRQMLWGGWVAVAAIGMTALLLSLFHDWPWQLTLPTWVEHVRGILDVASVWITIILWITAFILIGTPAGVRRRIAFTCFARATDLVYLPHGTPPVRRGLLLAEGTGVPEPNGQGLVAEHVLSRNPHDRLPAMSLGVARDDSPKDKLRAARQTFRYLDLALPRPLPHIVIDATDNGRLSRHLPGSQSLSLEGDVDRYFTVYVPAGYEVDALQLLTPDVLACLIDYGRGWDIEVIDDRLIVTSHRVTARSDRDETTTLLLFAELIGDELGFQAIHYTDPRARNPRTQVGAAGRRLSRRSGVWDIAAMVAAVAVMLGFSFVLGWFLDR